MNMKYVTYKYGLFVYVGVFVCMIIYIRMCMCKDMFIRMRMCTGCLYILGTHFTAKNSINNNGK